MHPGRRHPLARIHHRRIEWHRAGAGGLRLCKAGYRLALVARRTYRDKIMGSPARNGTPNRYQIYSADVCLRQTASLPPARPVSSNRACPTWSSPMQASASVWTRLCLTDLEVMNRVFATNNIGMAATFHPFIEGMSGTGQRNAGGHRERGRVFADCPVMAPTAPARPPSLHIAKACAARLRPGRRESGHAVSGVYRHAADTSRIVIQDALSHAAGGLRRTGFCCH
jgi:hypothetical protein